MPQSEKTLLPLMHVGSIQRLAIAGLLAGVTAACSSDTMRFADNPFSNPFGQGQTADATTTASISPSPAPQVYSSPLAPPQSASPVRQAAQSAVASGPVAAVGGSAKGWTAQGGSPVYVGTADTLATLSGRYNVPSAAILAANGLSSASQIAPGQQLTIPVYNPGGGALPSSAAVASAPQVESTFAAPAQHATAQPVRRAETVSGSLNEQAARLGQTSPAVAPPARQVVASLPTATDAIKPTPAQQKAIATVSPTPAAPPAAEQAAASKPEPAQASKAEDTGGSGFRWPARGRVINGFGKGNEGINIAVPEGTPVKAAEGGVVAYAGSELKGYGNLVLVRHDNGWVSAYANNAELKVKRGDKVARGQTIARSGQTGNVTSPQLHFELRKGSTPVDPLPHLAGL
ncbi:peptidoglycan DD-metalloendopeptidase family protein [Pseudochelatococcus contaminans]|uniref:Murein DD-endopeptidase MepM/ murein hydrolase activator NlpD n=1 Tax=Pseudochelatococcus contaminans TaxID=1538103 RepID=A0A7W5Z2U4_9HYPH|nr:M23 family metallopeptidase [Pseudochelatococcus contaminans]MBB3808636.1 murein DD-endopeptidase MepM/ murein hydrolase activator NlpD [Pseudochelatococcus contaminans]